MDHSREAAVRARAYQLWVESDYADGYQDQHWRQAEREILEQSAGRHDDPAPDQQPAPQRPQVHSDGMSIYPSVIDPAPKHAGIQEAAHTRWAPGEVRTVTAGQRRGGADARQVSVYPLGARPSFRPVDDRRAVSR